MKQGYLQITLVVFLANTILPISAAEEVDYKPACVQLQKAWLELSKLPMQGNRTKDKQNIREALERLYREQSKDKEANFAILSSDNELAEAISKIERADATTLPKLESKPAYTVTKSRKGTFTFTPTYGCTGAYSVPKGSRHYVDAVKHVGEIEVGQVKIVAEPVFDKWLTGDERVVMPDLN
jgi:hypothetical protein